MEQLILLPILALIPASIAKYKGHSFMMWWLFGTILCIVATPCALFALDNKRTARMVVPAMTSFRKRLRARTTAPAETF